MEYHEEQILTDYVWHYCLQQMFKFEQLGLKVASASEKADYVEGQRIRERLLEHYDHPDNPKVIAALAQGVDKFKETVRNRVLRDHPEVVNRCPKCNRIARTPRAKQCRWCMHDWHDS